MNALYAVFLEQGTSREVDARHFLLRAGDVARRLYLIEQGCARLYLIDAKGRETSTQFFFEGDVNGGKCIVTLPAAEFSGRFLRHVRSPGFKCIRHYVGIPLAAPGWPRGHVVCTTYQRA